jgi:Mrp family chromosome partitioning ATPase
LTPLHEQLIAIIERVFLPVASLRVGLISVGSEASATSLAGPMADVLATHTAARVCAVDANFGSPSLHTYFGVPNESGFLDAAGEPRTHLASVRVRNNLWVVPAGAAGRPLMAADATREATAHLLNSVDYAIVGLAAGDLVRDVLLRMLSGVVLVIDAQRTRRQDGRRATAVLREAGIPILGALLVNRDYPVPNAIYRRL